MAFVGSRASRIVSSLLLLWSRSENTQISGSLIKFRVQERMKIKMGILN